MGAEATAGRDFYREGWESYPFGWEGYGETIAPPDVLAYGEWAAEEWSRGYYDHFRTVLEAGIEMVYKDELKKVPASYREWLTDAKGQRWDMREYGVGVTIPKEVMETLRREDPYGILGPLPPRRPWWRRMVSRIRAWWRQSFLRWVLIGDKNGRLAP